MPRARRSLRRRKPFSQRVVPVCHLSVVTCRSFSVGLLHPLQCAGLSGRSLSRIVRPASPASSEENREGQAVPHSFPFFRKGPIAIF